MYDRSGIIEKFMDIEREMIDCTDYGHCREICPGSARMDSQNPPFPDFVGRRYAGLVIIGANPGTSSTEAFKRQDLEFNVRMEKLRNSGSIKDYNALLDYRNDASRSWTRTLCNEEYRRLLGYDLETVAFVNIVKCRTFEPKADLFQNVGKEIPRRCYGKYLERQLSILKPRYVACQWKPIQRTLAALGYNFNGAKIGSFNGQRNLPKEQRIAEVAHIFEEFLSDLN